MSSLITRTRQHVAAVYERAASSGVAWKRLYKVGKPFWVANESGKSLPGFVLYLLRSPKEALKTVPTCLTAWGYLATVLLLLYLNARINVFISDTLNLYMSGIEQKDQVAQMQELRHFLIALACITPVQIYNTYCQTMLAVRWQKWLTNNFFNGYYANLAWHKLLSRSDIDYPDQRMTDNIGAFCGTSVTLFMSLVDAIVNIYLWWGVLWKISSNLTWTVCMWALVGSVAVILIGKALVLLTRTLSEKQGALRFTLQTAQRDAEQIALNRGEQIARAQASEKLQAVIDTLIAILKRNRSVQFFTTPWNGLVPWLAPYFIAPLFAKGTIKFGVISQASMAVTALYGALTLLVAQFQNIATYTAVINRLGELSEAIDDYAKGKTPSDDSINVVEGDDILVDNITLKSADDDRELVSKLNLVLKKGESLCILGDHAVRSALVRALGRIWYAGSGSMTLPSREKIMMLNESLFVPETTLREAISYPCGTACADDNAILQMLTLMKLGELPNRAGGLDKVQNWTKLLPQEDQQRFGLARLYLQRPQYLVSEDATSKLDADTERMLYAMLAGNHTTVVTSTVRAELAKHHTWVLNVTGDATWTLERTTI